MFLILVVIFVLYLFCGSARAEAWTSDYIQRVIQDLESIAGSNINIYQQLEKINTNSTSIAEDVVVLRRTLTSVDSGIYEVLQALKTTNASLEDVKSQLSTLLTDIENLNTSINNVYNKLDENQKELLTELDKNNKAVLQELKMIRDAINGSEEEPSDYIENGIILSSIDSSNPSLNLKSFSLNYESRYTYTVKIYYSNPWEGDMSIFGWATDNLLSNPYNSDLYMKNFSFLGNVPPNTYDFILEYTVPSNHPKYLYFNWGQYITKIEVYRSIKGIVESLNQSNDLQQQQNQLQNQQNQLQQEQNNFMQQETQDSSVDIGGFSNVDSNDITSSGLTGIFNNIYNSISSWNSKDIKLPIPYTNTSITIPANYTYNMLSSAGGGWIINFISAVYYFIVGRFLVYSITNIINSIKSGKILETDNKNNITTDML